MDKTFFAVEIDGLDVAQEFTSDQRATLQFVTNTLNANYWYYPTGYYYISSDLPGACFALGDPAHSGQLIIHPVDSAYFWPLEITQHAQMHAALARNLEHEEAVLRWISERHPIMDQKLFAALFHKKFGSSG